MKTREKTLLVLVIGLLLLLGIGVRKYTTVSRNYSHALEHISRHVCQSKLGSIGALLGLYAEHHNGALPPNLSTFRSDEHLGLFDSLLICPAGGRDLAKPPEGKDVGERSDYLYVFWPDGMDTPEHYPLLYDRKLSNHSGKGIWILLVGGVGPKTESLPAVWDFGAGWLRRFADRNPQYNIPLPEDVE